MDPLRIDTARTAAGTVLSLAGELDLSTVGLAEDALFQIENEVEGPLSLDLRRLVFIDSTGLRFVLTAHARAAEHGRPFEIVRGPDPVHRVFLLTRLEERLPFVDAPGASGGGGPG
ncbi:MAG: STAS domain-containing protein [Actinomycetota bacterium]